MSAYVVAGAVAVLVALVGGLATDVGPWYRNLRKPSWNPPDWLFGPAWTLIYILIVWAAGSAWYATPEAQRLWLIVIPFAANAVLNALWSILFFTVKRPQWALFEVVLLWLSSVSLIPLVAGYSTLAAQLLVPYALWVTFASTLNLRIVQLNR
ncbi:MAG: TspO/MBR family protein [Pseudomonadales bacterium]